MDVRQANPHTPLSIPASTYNAMRDAAIANRSGGLQLKGTGSTTLARSSVIVLVKNTDGGPLMSRRAVALTEPVITPDLAEDQFKNEVVMKVETPGDNLLLTWGVLVGTLDDGAYGTAVVLGDVICWINILTISDLYVDVISGSQVPQSGMYGPAQIVWIAGGLGTATDTGEQWAVIRLGGSSTEKGFWAQITGSTEIDDSSSSSSSSSDDSNSNRWKYTWQEMQLQQNGVYVVRPGGRTTSSPIANAYAYNQIELNNSPTGIQGNSVDLTNLPSGMSLQPVRGNPVVWMRPDLNCQVPPVIEYAFEYVNAIDGMCASSSSDSSSSGDE